MDLKKSLERLLIDTDVSDDNIKAYNKIQYFINSFPNSVELCDRLMKKGEDLCFDFKTLDKKVEV